MSPRRIDGPGRSDRPLSLLLFDVLLGLWPEPERSEFGPSMRAMLLERISMTRASGLARAASAARELASVAWHGLVARSGVRGGPGAPASGGALRLDLRHAIRGIVRRPRYALTVFGTLALGLGLAVSAFSVFEATMLRPLPYRDGARLVSVWTTRDGSPTRWGEMSWLDLQDLRASTTTLAALGGHTSPGTAALAGTGRPSLTTAMEVTPGFFETIGLVAERGRLFEAADQSAQGVAIVSHDVWVDRFGGDPAAVGRVVTLDDRPVRIVGILTSAARWYPDARVGFWLPYAPEGQSRGSRNLVVVGRLADGSDLPAADAELRTLMDGLAAAWPDSDQGLSAEVRPLAEQMMGDTAPRVLRLLLAATLAVLLLATANVAGLALARAQERIPELAVLVSMGASRARLLRPLVIEGLLLAAAGGVAALLMGYWLPDAVLSHAPVAVPRAAEVGLDGRVLLAAFATTLLVSCIASVAPAWGVTTRSLRASLGSTRSGSAGPAGVRAREVLVVAQVAGALTLLTTAGLMLRSLQALTAVDPGFEASRVAQVTLRLEPARYPHAADVHAFQDRLREALSALPGVEGVAAVSMVPFGGNGLCDSLAPDGAAPVSDCVQFRSVTPGYFGTMGISLAAGRDFLPEEDDSARKVAVLTRSAAALAFPDGDAIGRTIDARGDRWQVVGVAEDSHLADLTGAAPPTVYLPFRQAPFRLVTAVLRARDPEGIAARLPEAVWSLDGDLAIRDVGTLTALIRGSASDQRFRGALFAGAAGVGLFLAMIGVAGLLLQLVQQRRREIGVRMALGSSRGAVIARVLRRALSLAAVGSVVGTGGSLLAGRVLGSFLFGVSAGDPATLLLAVAALMVAALTAAAAPAMRAAAVDPAGTLREE